jgi:hypothetical protein
MITISKKEYDELCEDSLILNYLRNGGVDNWEGYDFAMEDYFKDKE